MVSPYYQDSAVTIYHGDCRAVIPHLPPVDAVITDQSMPRMSGLRLAQALHAVRPGLPVILYTGHAEGLARSELETAGIREVLRKPVEPGSLEAALAAVLPVADRAD
jgi:CheY-like chemotaxis protein